MRPDLLAIPPASLTLRPALLVGCALTSLAIASPAMAQQLKHLNEEGDDDDDGLIAIDRLQDSEKLILI